MSPPSWRVLIVEDDPSVTFLHRKLVSRVQGFEVVAAASNGADMRREIERTDPHLLLLDLTLRGDDGVRLLRELRAAGKPIEAIAVTASRDARTVRDLVHLGVVDYLVKPFTPERLQQALALFRHRMSAIAGGALTQTEVDRLAASGRPPKRWLPKGLSQEPLESIRDILGQLREPVTAATVAEQTGLARVTVRRYLEYLVATDQASAHVAPSGPGRPSKLYALVDFDR